MKKTVVSFSILCGLILNGAFLIESVLSWDDKITHKDFSRYAAINSVLSQERGDYLGKLGFKEGPQQELKWDQTTLPVEEWIAKGAELEDISKIEEYIIGTGRSYNHFHNPLKPWNEAGLNDWVVLPLPIPPFQVKGQASLLWAQDGVQQAKFLEGDWSWKRARDDYYTALTSNTEVQRQEYFARTFRGLGHQMHLIQDAAVPYHVRNDAHPEDGIGMRIFGSYRFEKWSSENNDVILSILGSDEFKIEDYLPKVTSLDPSQLSLDPAYFEKSLSRSALFLDSDLYNGENPSASLILGLAEYTNANFFSEDTIFAAEKYTKGDKHYFPYPKQSSTDLQLYMSEGKLPEMRIAEDNVVELDLWIAKDKDGELIDHFVKPIYFSNELRRSSLDDYAKQNILRRTFYQDEVCFIDYVKKLAPRAVGYSAGLLNYFFRGELQVTAIPVVYKNGIQSLEVRIKNKTPTKETMKDGYFVLTYRYTPTGGKEDGSEDKFGLAWANYPNAAEALNDQLKYADDKQKPEDQDEKVIDFLIPDPIPLENSKSLKFTLAFKGNLGKYVGDTFETYERDAVIGKVLTPGEIKFEEEWDNGLNGNRTWAHTDFNLFDQNLANGSTSNVIVGDNLVKDNIRNAGYKTARVNGSFVSTQYNNGEFRDKLPIKITPDTYIEFKIDEMRINQIPPAPPGYTNHWQGLMLRFNNGLGIQYYTQGQGVYLGPNVVYAEFDLNLIIVNNIYQLFKRAEIPIPAGDMYLEVINFVQQLFDLDHPSEVEHHQHMKIDSIRIIEGKQQ